MTASFARAWAVPGTVILGTAGTTPEPMPSVNPFSLVSGCDSVPGTVRNRIRSTTGTVSPSLEGNQSRSLGSLGVSR
jgi:hypothetical protein